jgi:hypothetical protein
MGTSNNERRMNKAKGETTMKGGSSMEDGKVNVPEIEDTMIVAYLLCRGHEYEPVMNDHGRVTFKVYGDVDVHLREMYEGYAVSIMHYLKCLKQVRASMFSKKDENKPTQYRKGE